VHGLRFGTTQTLIDGLPGAKRVELDTFVLRNSRLIDALEVAAESGTDVRVRLGDPTAGSQRKANLKAKDDLERHGVNVAIQPGYGPDAIHDKIARVDDVIYRDDRNWTTGEWETVLVDDRSRAGQDVTTTKAAALVDEVELIRHGKGHEVLVSTESIGPGPVVDALIARAKQGDHVRLMYKPGLHDLGRDDALRRLRRAGVSIRESSANHKICIVGDRAWIGSANATSGAALMREWGQTVTADLAAQLRRTLEHVWGMAKT